MSKSTRTRAAATRPSLPQEIATAVAAAASKQATDIVVLDLRKASAFTDYFVICSANNQRQIKAIADAVEEALAKRRISPSHVEGYPTAEWVLMDYFDFVVHVFTEGTRTFYGLERLWGSATPVDLRGLLAAERARR
ncbi:MAG TPA: ribosome silencing factor [Vicinamibacterales bacterium]|nr:ribosome silencing factor [Vicinamibacterales bacterium]